MGLYEVELTYTNDPRIGFRGAILDDPAMSPYAKSMACTAVSNALRIEVPAPAAMDEAAEEPGPPEGGGASKRGTRSARRAARGVFQLPA